MQINLEQADKHSVQAYTENSLKINDAWYSQNLIVNNQSIITDWSAKSICSLTHEDLQPVLESNPEIIIIGHQEKGIFPPAELMAATARERIGLESMSIDAACRTFNILLNEQRNVALVILW